MFPAFTLLQGGIYPLVAMLKSKAKDVQHPTPNISTAFLCRLTPCQVQRNAAKVLAHLAVEQSIRVSIVDEGAISPLLDLLIDPVSENSMAACKALLNIAVCAVLSAARDATCD